MVLRLIIGLAATAVALALAARRLLFLYRLAMSGQPAPDRAASARDNVGEDVKGQVVEVLGQRKLLKWTVPGLAHLFVMWAFIILITVYLEAYGALFTGLDFHIPLVGTWDALGFLQDFIAVAAFLGLIVFAIIRLKNSPARLDRELALQGLAPRRRVAGPVHDLQRRVDDVPVPRVGRRHGQLPLRRRLRYVPPRRQRAQAARPRDDEALESVGLLLHIGVMLVFLIIVLNSKHLHIFLAPLNVMFKRRPDGLGAVQPMMSDGKPIDFEEADPDEDTFGRGKIEDFTWKGFLDFASCTECGRCQSQCPAWNTGKPLSPKTLIMDLRDHALAKAPYILAAEEDREVPGGRAQGGRPPARRRRRRDGRHRSRRAVVLHQLRRLRRAVPGRHRAHRPHRGHAPLPGDDRVVLPLRGRRHAEEPGEQGQPVGHVGDEAPRLDRGARNLDHRRGPIVEDKMPDDTEYLFWVGCAGALEDRAKKTTKAVAELLHIAGVKFAVLGPMEACTGDPARRLGMEFVFQMLAQQNIETLNEAGVKKIVATCPHCFNTLANEYPQLGGNYDVVHHTQLLSHLVETGKLMPVTPIKEKITYHDPCFLGRHNKVYNQPRDIMAKVPGIQTQEMHRCKDRGFCCGAGGARMWMEERIGKRINTERVDEALETDPDTVRRRARSAW